MSKLFISYNHGDKEFARRLAVDLQRLDIDVWLDEFQCKIGDSLFEAVQRGISASEYIGVVLTPSSVASPWVKKEVEAALGEEVKRDCVKVLPLLLADCKIPPFLAERKYADFRNRAEYSESLRELAERLGVHAPQTLPLGAIDADALIQQLANARGIPLSPVVEAQSSHGTAAFKARLRDGKGVLYCHASGPRSGHVFYVQKGIGWYYEYVLGGSISALGLPTSHEEMRDISGSQISYFEGGYVEWAPKTSVAKAVSTFSGNEVVIGERALK
jgi:TIR domain